MNEQTHLFRCGKELVVACNAEQALEAWNQYFIKAQDIGYEPDVFIIVPDEEEVTIEDQDWYWESSHPRYYTATARKWCDTAEESVIDSEWW